MDNEKKEVVVVTSGHFNPLHKGHVEYLELAKKLGDKLIVIVNNDKQAMLKTGSIFMNEQDRMAIIKALRCVDEVFLSIDEDRTVCESLRALKPDIFAKGGDRNAGEIPEGKVCEELGIKIIDGLGAKVENSSRLRELFSGEKRK
jgi:rfaE bifunctional protein nucleotidyltransferase chain/domain